MVGIACLRHAPSVSTVRRLGIGRYPHLECSLVRAHEGETPFARSTSSAHAPIAPTHTSSAPGNLLWPHEPSDTPTGLSSVEEVERVCMRNLLASPDERVFFKDRQSRFLLVSSGWLAALSGGRSLEQVIGKTDFDFFSRPHAAAALEDERLVIATGKPIVAKVERETFHDRPDLWVSTSKLPLLDDQGEIIGTWGIVARRDGPDRSRTSARAAGAARLGHRAGEPGRVDGPAGAGAGGARTSPRDASACCSSTSTTSRTSTTRSATTRATACWSRWDDG